MFFCAKVPFLHKILVYSNYYKLYTYNTLYTSKSSIILKTHYFDTHKSVHSNILFFIFIKYIFSF